MTVSESCNLKITKPKGRRTNVGLMLIESVDLDRIEFMEGKRVKGGKKK